MVALLELKEKFKKIFNKYDIYMIPGMKFIVALVALLMLNASIGYMSRLKNPLIAVAVAILCAFLPNGAYNYIPVHFHDCTFICNICRTCNRYTLSVYTDVSVIFQIYT